MIKADKHAKHDATRKDAPRLPGTRLKDEHKAESMEKLYSLCPDESKADLIVDAAKFAIENKKAFISFRDNKVNK